MKLKQTKMRVLFVYPNQTGQVSCQLGIGYLSSILKEKGHITGLFDATYLLYEPFKSITTKLFEKINKFKPDILAFSCRSLEFPFARRLAQEIKKVYKIKIIFGGIHPTIQPDEVLKCEAIDYICVGEAEKAFLEFVESFPSEKKINNIWTRERRTPLNPLIQDLDSIPFPDRDLFEIPEEKNNLIITSRGCPYNCSYCFNCILKKIYKGQKYVRYRGVDNVIDEIRELLKHHKLDHFFICDDLFTSNKERVISFCEKYKKEFKVPFTCNARAGNIDKDIARALKEANCIEVKMGIETGNERLRKDVLKKYITDDQIREAFKICKRAGLKTYANNMIGLPFETEKTIKQTFELNREVKPDAFQFSILCPFKGTDIYNTYKDNGYFSQKKQVLSYYDKSFATFPNISERKLLTYQRFAYFYVKYPKFEPLISSLRIFPLERIGIFNSKILAKLYASIRNRRGGNITVDVLAKKRK